MIQRPVRRSFARRAVAIVLAATSVLACHRLASSPNDVWSPQIERAVYETLSWTPWDSLTDRASPVVVLHTRLRDLRANDVSPPLYPLDSAILAQRVARQPSVSVRDIDLTPVGTDTTVVTLELWPTADPRTLGVVYSVAHANGWLVRKLAYTVQPTRSGLRLLQADWGEP